MKGVEYKHFFKFIVIGPSDVGKTSLVNRLINGHFSREASPTIGCDYRSVVLEIEGEPVKLQIWDTSGQERFRSIAKSYFRHAVGVVVVYDITDRRSFDDLSSWLNDVHQLSDPNASIVLIGNKLDRAAERAVTTAEAQIFAGNDQLTYLEASALGGDNVNEAFHRAAKAVYEKAEGGILMAKAMAPTANVQSGSAGGGRDCC
jgi:small GTP-binding protein